MKLLSRYTPALLSAALLLGAAPRALAQSDAKSAGAKGDVKQVRIVAKEFGYEPSSLTVKPGEKVAVTLVNHGKAPHNIEFEWPGGKAELKKNVAPGKQGTLTFTAPSKPGTYEFDCPVDNHKQHGMKGTLTVAE